MIVAVAFVLLIALAVPIAFVLGLTGVIHILSTGDTRFFLSVTQRMFTGVDSFSLLAIPLFILTGELMNYGGMTSRLANLARSLVGHLQGGLAHVDIVVGMFMAAIVGSATAMTAILCKTFVPEMTKDNYPEEYSVAVSTAASIIGPIIPPSMFFIIYGVAAGVSIGGLFIAGIVPGVLLGLSFMFLAFRHAKKNNLPTRERANLSIFFSAFISALPGLLIPLVILGGILSGVFTPTESAGASTLVAFIVGVFIYKELKLKDLPRIFSNSAVITASVVFILATANIFAWTLAIGQVPQKAAEVILSLTQNPLVFLLIVNIMLLLVGMVMEAFAAIVILVPVLTPIVAVMGIDPLHFGVVVVFNLVIGMITPPVGICLFVASSLTNVKLERLIRVIIPFILASIFVLLVVTYVPQLSLFLPKLLMK